MLFTTRIGIAVEYIGPHGKQAGRVVDYEGCNVCIEFTRGKYAWMKTYNEHLHHRCERTASRG